jgi:hypothetical protein
MELKLTPSFFYGSAAATVMGLSLGIALHGPWESKAGGPRFMFASAAAAEPAGDEGARDATLASNDQSDPSYLYEGYLPASPMPVVRLKPDRYPNLWPDSQAGVTQASVDETQRVNTDDLYKADVSTEDMFRADPADDELPAADQTPRAPVRYSARQAAEANPSF